MKILHSVFRHTYIDMQTPFLYAIIIREAYS